MVSKSKELQSAPPKLLTEFVGGETKYRVAPVRFGYGLCVCVRNREKGVLAKGVSAGSSVAQKETKNTQGHWAQPYIWHSERHSQERRTLKKKHALVAPPYYTCRLY